MRALFAIALYFSGDCADKGYSRPAVLAKTMKALTQKGSLKDLVCAINEIDDIVDDMPPEQRLRIGKALLGVEPCEFLLNEKVCVPSYFAAARKLAGSRVLSMSEEMAFSNLYAHLIQQGAKAEIEYARTGAIADRARVVDLNEQLCEASGIHIIHHLQSDEAIRAAVFDTQQLSPDQMEAAMPKAALTCRLAERCDDVRDFFTDFETEKAGALGPFTRNFMNAVWDLSVQQGMRSQVHPDLIAKRRTQMAEFAALASEPDQQQALVR